MSRLLVLVAALVGLPLPSQAEDWPQFRGPTGQGTSREVGLPVEWSPTKNVVWKQAIAGLGWSSPIVYQGRVFLTTAVPVENSKTKDQSLRAICLDAKTGKLLWDSEVFRQDGAKAKRIHPKASHANPTPLTDGQRLYVHFGHQGTAALDLDGKVLWKTVISYNPVHGNGGSPILVDDSLIFSCDGLDQQFVIALDRSSGKTQWKTVRQTDSFKKFAFSTPQLITVGAHKQLISPGAGVVCAYDPANGKEIWRATYGDGYSVVPRPVFAHGLVFIATGFDDPGLIAVRPDGKGDVTKTHIAWETQRGAPLTPSVLVVGDELYMVSDLGIASCRDAKTGKVHWEERAGGGHSASPLYADGKIYFQSEQGSAVVVKAGQRFEVLGRNSLQERTLASYAASDGALFIRTEKHMWRIAAKP